MYARADKGFLERIFQKLLLNTWWVNRKDVEGKNVFQGGFLGMDNIGVFDRNMELPTGVRLDQSDGTSWMGMYCLNMLAIGLELAQENPSYSKVSLLPRRRFQSGVPDRIRQRDEPLGSRNRVVAKADPDFSLGCVRSQTRLW